MSNTKADWLSDAAMTAWDALAGTPGAPQLLDVSILVTPDPTSRPGRILLRARTERGDDLGTCYVFNNEWYPGAESTAPFSHYAPTLRRVLDSMARRGETDPLRLQVLKALKAPAPSGRLLTVLLKFVIAPEYTLTGSELETVYSCPLSAFYSQFVGISWDPRRRRRASGRVRGEAIHNGYRRAAATFVATRDPARARAAYLEGVRSIWVRRLPTLFLDRPTKPTADHTRPVEAADGIVAFCQAAWPDAPSPRLYQERLFYAPSRGLSGRADRIERPATRRAPLRLVEVKSGSSFGSERDPVSGDFQPGGVQALSYREILRAFDIEPVEAIIEQVSEETVTAIPLARHPLVTRLGVELTGTDERAIDLIAQARNVGFCVTSGLFSGYDRYLLDSAGARGRFLGTLGGDFDLYRGQPPCHICAAAHRGVCRHGGRGVSRPLANLFRYAPGRLFAYWGWFHRQLKAADRANREWLYHLVMTPPGTLERQEGVTVAGLKIVEVDGLEVAFERSERIETRIREDDRVLVTPLTHAPGQVVSVEGDVVAVSDRRVRVRLRDGLDDRSTEYRLDQLGAFKMRPWELEGLTDFLVTSVSGAAVRGRELAVSELPQLAQALLAATKPVPLGAAPIPDSDDLNSSQRRALSAALALEPGGLMLIQGPPGTGKTLLIAHLARAVLARHLFEYDANVDRRPVLILANTHRAANEVVRKLVDRFPDLRPFIVRVGSRRADMEPEVAGQVLAERVGAADALRHVDLAADGPSVLLRLVKKGNLLHDHAGIFVGTLGAADAADVRGLAFEMVIVDETGQATEPAMLQALRHLPFPLHGRLVLVGDHRQLPPVVPAHLTPVAVPESFAKLGLQPGDSLRTSAFERLSRLHPEVLLTLSEQYRMNAAICELVSTTFYDARLRPGSPAVAQRRLDEWLASRDLCPPEGVLGSSVPIVVVDTAHDPLARDRSTRFTRAGAAEESRDNPREADIIAQLIWSFLAPIPRRQWSTVLPEIGVISPYRRQNNLITQRLIHLDPLLAQIRVDTVDRFQGGEREIIVLSLVSSNSAAAIGSLHCDWRRMNVAISRARRKLVIVGDRWTFTRDAGRPEETDAKGHYRRLFAHVDQLVGRTGAAVVDGRTIDAEAT